MIKFIIKMAISIKKFELLYFYITFHSQMFDWLKTDVAPLKTAEPLNNHHLLSYYLFIRHGARVPVVAWPNYPQIDWMSLIGASYSESVPRRRPIVNGQKIDLSKSPLFGRLIDSGVKQEEDLGELYRHYLVDQQKLLPEKFDPTLIRVRSSYAARCIESGTCLLDKMYPPESPNEELIIETGERGTEALVPHPELNDYFRSRAKEFMQTPEFIKRRDEIPSVIKQMFSAKDIDFLMAGDFIHCLKFNGFEIPQLVKDTPGLYEQMMSNLAFYSTGFINSVGRPAYGPALDLLSEAIHNFLNKKDQYRFTLFSGHDCSIAAILVSLGICELQTVPPYASHLAIELWQPNSDSGDSIMNSDNLILRFVLNGQVLKLNGKETTSLKWFMKEIALKPID
ncbi:histidine acid phosphatase [Tritrichomonas foetus]|uniref:Histidine acid phosphatase n=1 Tax=Tritrichomonas foetus TaxID=1144522 RepID=A0A1J4JDU2_9EUKA|nr:histidine acid phosphatase [Tritrichomonas foetus]|eukprot:OHS95843.1 histidine acid phosphatase [Tritrichomonas foetus]